MSNEAQRSQPQPQPHYNPAAELEIPIMAPRGAQQRDTRRDPPREREADAPRERALERERLVGQRPVQGLGEPQPFPASTILNQAHGLLEQYKRDRDSIDPVFVNIMVLQALGTYGSQASKVSQLTNEVGRLRKVLEARWGDDGEQRDGGGGRPATTGERARARITERGGQRRGGGVFGRLRGRGR